MSARKWSLLCAGVVVCGAVVGLRKCDADGPVQDKAARLIQRRGLREATPPQEPPSAGEAPRGITAMEFHRLCAVNCLHFVNRLHGVRARYADIKAALQPGQIGVSLRRLAEVAEALGYGVMARKLSRTEMFAVTVPMIALASPAGAPDAVGHFGVIVPVPSRNGYWVFDPPRKRMWVSRDQMAEQDGRRVAALLLVPPGAE